MFFYGANSFTVPSTGALFLRLCVQDVIDFVVRMCVSVVLLGNNCVKSGVCRPFSISLITSDCVKANLVIRFVSSHAISPMLFSVNPL